MSRLRVGMRRFWICLLGMSDLDKDDRARWNVGLDSLGFSGFCSHCFGLLVLVLEAGAVLDL
jgi:hypothetical protein